MKKYWPRWSKQAVWRRRSDSLAKTTSGVVCSFSGVKACGSFTPFLRPVIKKAGIIGRFRHRSYNFLYSRPYRSAAIYKILDASSRLSWFSAQKHQCQKIASLKILEFRFLTDFFQEILFVVKRNYVHLAFCGTRMCSNSASVPNSALTSQQINQHT